MALIKKENEIEILREAGKRHAQILSLVAAEVKPGVSTKTLDDLIYKLITEGGDTPSLLNFQPEFADRPFPASSCISINEEVVHGIPNENNRILKEGDIVSIDFGLKHRGMFTDAAVTVAVGAISTEAKKLLDATREALDAGIAAAQGGKHIGDIGYAVEKVCKKYKLGLVKDLCGHGVGNEAHEDPYVPNFGERKTGVLLKPGMVLAIEPMFNLGTGRVVLMPDGYTFRTADRKYSAHFEHTVLITAGKAEILTK